MKVLGRLASVLFSIYGFLIFILLMFILLPFIAISSLFGKVKGGNVIYKICTFWADCAMLAWGIRHYNIYESPHDSTKASVFVFNHISYMDIPVLLEAFKGQPIRVLGKASMARVPVFGFIYRNSAILVDRSSSEARSRSVGQLISILKKNISVVIAPEGTFNLTDAPLKEFYDGAFRIAIETQTPIKPVVFIDAYDRLNYHTLFSLSPGRSRAVFLSEVNVNGLTLEDIPMLKDKVYNIMQDALIRYKASWIR